MGPIRPLRGPYEQIAGLMLLPRAVDEIRAGLPYPRELVVLLGVPEATFVAAMREAPDDAAVAAWVTEHCNTTTFAAINHTLVERGIIGRAEAAG